MYLRLQFWPRFLKNLICVARRFVAPVLLSAGLMSFAQIAVAQGGPVVSLSVVSLAFPNQPVGTTSASQNLTLTNSGATALTVTSIVVTDPTDFAETNTCGNSVAATASCTISISFAPTGSGIRTASVTITDNALNSPQSILLIEEDPGVFPFVPTGSMIAAFEYPTSTLLNNGMVLVAGGEVSYGTTPELYDPTTGTFTATGSMITPRVLDTATLLNNGKVLFTGGLQITGSTTPVLASAELYDPATGTFTATGNMTTPRYQHTATLLNNGMVLISGGHTYSVGVSGVNDLDSAELYDPASGTFAATGNMTVARYGHTSTLLNSGTVLITGGSTNGVTIQSSAELFNPTGGTFDATGSMALARYEHSATLLNNGAVLVAGGADGNASAELYSPATGTFTETGSMTIPRLYFTATLLNDGMVLVAGGYSGAIVASAELYAPSTGTFTAAATMTVAREYQTATLLNNGQVLVAGGQGVDSYLASAELYALPAVSLSATTIAFGNETIGITSASQNVTLTNNLPTAVNIASIALTGANPSDFTQSNSCGASLASGASCTVTVTFTPTATGNRSASITITDDASGSPQTISLTGTGIAPTPVVSLSTLNLTFANQLLNTTSPSQQIILNNTGYAPLTITSIAVTGTNSGDFAQANTCGPSVAAGASCMIGVTFAPTAPGTRTASVTITDNASDSPEAVRLTGTGAVPTVAFSATSLNFSSVAVGSTGAAQILTMTNTGNGTLTISSVAVTGFNMSDFAQTNTCDTSVAAGSNCTISITFSPTAMGTRTASLTATDNASGSPQSVTLTGTGLVPVASISPSSIVFPNQYVGTSSLPQTVTLMNTGAAPLVIASVTTSPSDFGPLSSCGNSLSVGSSCSIGVFFDPTVGGSRTGTLTITDNAAGSPQTVSLTGTGLDFSMAATSATATVTPGQTASYSITVAPNGGFNQSIAFSCSGAPAQSTCTVSPNSVALNGTTVGTVTVAVTTAAASVMVPKPPTNIPTRMTAYRLTLLTVVLAALAFLANCWRRERRPRLAYVLAFLLLVCGGMAMSACSTGSGNPQSNANPATPAGNYTLAVKGTFTSGATTLTHNTNLTLTVQ
jgi:hypothetical protein